MTFDFTSNNQQIIHNQHAEPWKVTLVDTGENTMTGGRIKKVKEYIKNEPFLLTYGDGVCNVNLKKLVSFHKENKCTVTITAIQPSGRFGVLDLDKDDKITGFEEKPKGDGAWINGGFMVAEPELLDFIENDSTILEREPFMKLAKDSRLISFKHDGFWYAMDTLRDKLHLEGLWETNKAPWKTW